MKKKITKGEDNLEIAEVTFLNTEENPEHIRIIKKALNRCYEEEKIKEKSLYVDVILTNGKHVRELNKKYRDIDKETDVLSFPMFERNEILKMDGKTENVLGDIVISLEQVEKQAKEYGHSFERELSYMVVHSFYHLIGYDHLKDDEKTVMREKEKKIMNELM